MQLLSSVETVFSIAFDRNTKYGGNQNTLYGKGTVLEQ